MKKLPKSITLEEFSRLIKVVSPKDRAFKVAAILSYGSGLRISEVIKLNSTHFQANYIQIIDSKGGRDRVVPLPKGWKKWMFDFIPMTKGIRALQKNFKKYSFKAGLNPDYTFHSFRHGFATRLVEKGVPLNQIQLLLGHSDISTTGIYLKARPLDALNSYEDLF